MHASRFLRAAGPLTAVALLFACSGFACSGDDGDSDADAAISASCMEATTRSDLAWVQDNIFTPSCAAFGACHMGAAASADGLNLETGMSELELVGIDSVEDPSVKLVVAGDPDNSYLLMIMGREPVPSGVTINRTMPLGNPLLCDEKIEAVARWVQSL